MRIDKLIQTVCGLLEQYFQVLLDSNSRKSFRNSDSLWGNMKSGKRNLGRPSLLISQYVLTSKMKNIKMDALECIKTKLDISEFDPDRKISPEVKMNVLEAARMTGSGVNSQHWRFVLVQDKHNLRKLARDSTTGKWIENCNFAVILLTNPSLKFHQIDAGRAAQDMQLAAWNSGVGSRFFTGIDAQGLAGDFGIPRDLSATLVLGFGYPRKNIKGKKKNRKPLSELSFIESFGNKLDPTKLSLS